MAEEEVRCIRKVCCTHGPASAILHYTSKAEGAIYCGGVALKSEVACSGVPLKSASLFAFGASSAQQEFYDYVVCLCEHAIAMVQPPVLHSVNRIIDIT